MLILKQHQRMDGFECFMFTNNEGLTSAFLIHKLACSMILAVFMALAAYGIFIFGFETRLPKGVFEAFLTGVF